MERSDQGYEIQSEAIDLIHNSDGLIILLDLTDEPAKRLTAIVNTLQEARMSIQKQACRVEVVREKGTGEIRIATSGTLPSCSPEQIRELLHSYGIRNALVRIYGQATIGDVEDAIFENVTTYKPALVIGNKIDLLNTRTSTIALGVSLLQGTEPILVSCLTRAGLNRIGDRLFHVLGIIRVYTKEPNQTKPSDFPFVVRTGTTVKELARSIHTDLAERYRYSRIWGSTSKFAGERVGPDHVLGDKDIVEIHTA
jgi:ribosome-interacting GTPase 1